MWSADDSLPEAVYVDEKSVDLISSWTCLLSASWNVEPVKAIPKATSKCPVSSSPYHSQRLALVVNIVVHIKLKNTIIWNRCAGGNLLSGFLFEFITTEYQEYMSLVSVVWWVYGWALHLDHKIKTWFSHVSTIWGYTLNLKLIMAVTGQMALALYVPLLVHQVSLWLERCWEANVLCVSSLMPH